MRYLLSHQAGVPAIDRRLSPEELQAWTPVVEALAEQTPFWEPGTAHGYHALSYGYLVGEVVRRITGRSLGTFFAEEVAGPLGLEFFIGLPEEYEDRVSPIVGANFEGAAAPTTATRRRRAVGFRLHSRRPGTQPWGRHPGPGLDEPAGVARRRNAGGQRDHQRRLAVADVRRAHRHGRRRPVRAPADAGSGRTGPYPAHVGGGPGVRLGRDSSSSRRSASDSGGRVR